MHQRSRAPRGRATSGRAEPAGNRRGRGRRRAVVPRGRSADGGDSRDGDASRGGFHAADAAGARGDRATRGEGRHFGSIAGSEPLLRRVGVRTRRGGARNVGKAGGHRDTSPPAGVRLANRRSADARGPRRCRATPDGRALRAPHGGQRRSANAAARRRMAPLTPGRASRPKRRLRDYSCRDVCPIFRFSERRGRGRPQKRLSPLAGKNESQNQGLCFTTSSLRFVTRRSRRLQIFGNVEGPEFDPSK